jgi:hypothetical protein
MTLIVRPGFQFDTDASMYIEAVEVADTQTLETNVRYAINNFVIGCKNDGIWSAIKVSCILAGARKKEGAFIDLKTGTQLLTNNNFVDADYNRKTGLYPGATNSTKYLNSNRNNNADPQNSKHISIYCSSASTIAGFSRLINAGNSAGGDTYIVTNNTIGLGYVAAVNDSAITTLSIASSTAGFLSLNRSSSSSFAFRMAGVTGVANTTSTTPRSENITLYRGLNDSLYSNPRIAFYSIGESLDLAKLDARVTDLITAIGAAIP